MRAGARCEHEPIHDLFIQTSGCHSVVVDEMVGVWITLLAAPAGHIWYGLAAFVLFRFFDILKPLGIRRMENLPGGVGVMMDDVLAGVYGFIVLIVARWLME